MDTAELKSIISRIEAKSKEQSRVDTGMLERSIYGIINERGVAEFGEMFYGQFGNNSKLAENIKAMFPKDLPYKLIYYDFEGNEYVGQEQTKRGRVIEREKIPSKIKETQAPRSSKSIRNFLKYINAVPKAKNTDSSKIEKTNASAKITKYLNSLKDGKTND